MNKVIFSLIILSGFLFACNPVRHIPEGKSLLIKNEIVTDTNIIAQDRFEKYLKQKPNRKILGLFRFHLNVYNLGNPGKNTEENLQANRLDSTGFKAWLRSIGEEPVILDSELTNRSKQQFEIFLHKNGFFNVFISDSTQIRKKKAKVTYYIKYNTPYINRTLSYSTQDAGISPLINQCQKGSLLVPGDRYNEDVFEKERERVTTDLKDRGYYFFNKNYITYQADTSLGTHQADIYLYINRVNENIGGSQAGNYPITDHQIYRLRNIYVQTDYNPKDPNHSIPLDTTFYNGYYILSVNKYRVIRDNVLVRNLFIRSGDQYLQRDLDLTYKRLQELNIFKFINLLFHEVPRDSLQKEYLLDLQINLTPADKQDFTIETEVTNTGSNIGLAGSFGWRNKNAFRGAEVFEFKLKGGLEAIPNTKSSETNKKFYVFNTWDIGPDVSLGFKKFLLPGFIEKKTSRYANPKTNFNLGYNHQNSPDYVRSITNFGFNYAFTPTSKQRMLIYPLDINAVQVDLTPSFEEELIALNDPQLMYAYETHIITALRVTWFTTNQSPGSSKDFVYFRTTGEFAYKAFARRLQPSQYYKIDFDFSHHHNVNKFNTVISRLTMGIGIPYGKSLALPFEKSFFAGGANSMRAWYARTLGPGSYVNTLDIEQSGDMKIEANLEHRSELFEFTNGMKLEGAAFVDIGNIWTLNEDVSRPGGKFVASNILSELGIGSGIGLRFNFSFFIFRLDLAVKLRDPSLNSSERWVYSYQKFVIGDITPTIAIGYPF